MNWSGLPPLNSLRAFAALAEAGSYKKAAITLSVTHAAVSQQVRALEERLSTSLVVPDGRGIRLTKDGLILAHKLDAGFSMIRAGVENILTSGATHPVQLSTSPAFAMEWLMPRIQDFQSTHPEIPLLLNPTVRLVDLSPDGVEVAIRYRDKRRLEKPFTPVLVSDMIVIAAPALIQNRSFANPEDLMNLPWLQELNTNEVADWFAYRGTSITKPLMITQMPGNLIMQAVRRGDGISYTARAFFEEDIQAGRMKVLFSDSAVGIYCIEICKQPLRQSVQTLVDWLRSQSQTCVV
ncbi:MAG: LysR family transcriptional regulator [Gammaproteobacteria bacterium]|nr:LysR family transcriptional regulator [Gammaproteobacteria bacterium]